VKPCEVLDLAVDLSNVVIRLLDGGPAVAFVLPSLHIILHLLHAALLLRDLVAHLAIRLYLRRVVDELEAASLAHPVLLVALPAEGVPFPVPALPFSLVKPAHGVGGLGGGEFGDWWSRGERVEASWHRDLI
jgi:hypothetical protein